MEVNIQHHQRWCYQPLCCDVARIDGPAAPAVATSLRSVDHDNAIYLGDNDYYTELLARAGLFDRVCVASNHTPPLPTQTTQF